MDELSILMSNMNLEERNVDPQHLDQLILEKAQKLLENPPAFCPLITYKNLSKIVAFHEFKKGNLSQGIFHLVSSQGVHLNQTVSHNMYSLDEDYKIVKKVPEINSIPCLNFKEKIENYDDILNILSEMPTEWTLVQITLSYDLPGINFSPSKPETRPYEIHLVRMACGSHAKRFPPFEIRLHPKLIEDKFYFWKKLEYILKKEMSKFRDKIDLLDNELNNIIEFCEDLFTHSKSVFLGTINNRDYHNELIAGFEKILRDMPESVKASIPESEIRLLQNVILAAPSLDPIDLHYSLKEILKEKKVIANAKNILERILKKFKNKIEVKRNPVILILDQILECIPFEVLSFLDKEPITRGKSLLMIYQLFQAHKSTIKDGYKIVKNRVNYLISKEEDLGKAANKWEEFIHKRFPKWKTYEGSDLTKLRDYYLKALNKDDIYFYYGHGAGLNIFPLKLLSKITINSIVFLAGCSTCYNKLRGENVEGSSPAHFYLASLSPCVIGSLWPVYDLETCKFFMALISAWTDERLRTNDDLLSAIQVARSAVLKLFNKSAFIAIGIPVKLIL